MKKIFMMLLAAGLYTHATAQIEKGNLLIRNGTVLTITKGNLENTDVLIKDGKITQIGKAIAAPAGAKVIDATGLYVMPGIIDAHSHIGLQEINEYSAAVTPEVWTGDAINPYDVSIYRALARMHLPLMLCSGEFNWRTIPNHQAPLWRL